MKKLMIAGAIATAIASAGYFALNKAGDVAEQQINQFVETYQNQPMRLKQLESSPLVKKAQWMITDSNENHIKSLLSIQFAPTDEVFELPLETDILRGKTTYKDKSYGFGKVVTHPDLAGFGQLPTGVSKETFTSTQYIGLDGELISVDSVAPIQNKEIAFGGLLVETETSLITRDNFLVNLASEATTLANEESGEGLEISPIKLTATVNREGGYTGESQPFSVQFNDVGSNAVEVNFGKGVYEGSYEMIDALVVPLSHASASYDSLSVTTEGVPIKLTNLSAKGGFYASGDNKADFSATLAADFDEVSIKQIMQAKRMAVSPQHVDFSYSLTKIPYKAINTYYDAMDKTYQLEPDNSEFELFSDAELEILVTSLQGAGASLKSALLLKAAEGQVSADASAELSEAGKKMTYADFKENLDSRRPPLALFNASVDVISDEAVVNATQLAMMLQMMLGVRPNDGKYTVNMRLTDGKTTINGKEM